MQQVDINMATEAELMNLRGIGFGRAARIIAARPFTDTHDLVSSRIIPEGVYLQIVRRLYPGNESS